MDISIPCPATRVRDNDLFGFLLDCQNAYRHACFFFAVFPGSGAERAPPRHGNRGARVYDRGASRALGAVHEGGTVLAKAARGEPPRTANCSRAKLDFKVNAGKQVNAGKHF